MSRLDEPLGSTSDREFNKQERKNIRALRKAGRDMARAAKKEGMGLKEQMYERKLGRQAAREYRKEFNSRLIAVLIARASKTLCVCS